MTFYPILFFYRDLVAGRGFVASVKADGRVLLSEEKTEVWFYGVNPGGVAGGGKSRAEAAADFRERYRTALYDIAAESRTFDEFRASVVQFFQDTHGPAEQDWTAAHAAVRSGALHDTDLRRVKVEDRPMKIEVTLVQDRDVQPSVNEPDVLAEAA